MKKTHIPSLTILLTCRIESPSRLANTLATLNYYRNYTDAEIILLEADKRPIMQKHMKIDFPDVEYIFIRDDNPVFHRTRYLNLQMKRARTANTANIDVDVIVPVPQLLAANACLLENPDVVIALPYDGRFVSVDACRSDLFRRRCNPAILTEIPGRVQLMFGFISVGGAYLVNIARYKNFGLENENFPGWGPEDFERVTRLDILGHKPVRIPGVIYHLNHPRGINSGDMYEPLMRATKLEYCKVCAMMPAQLRAYVDSWNWCR